MIVYLLIVVFDARHAALQRHRILSPRRLAHHAFLPRRWRPIELGLTAAFFSYAEPALYDRYREPCRLDRSGDGCRAEVTDAQPVPYPIASLRGSGPVGRLDDRIIVFRYKFVIDDLTPGALGGYFRQT